MKKEREKQMKKAKEMEKIMQNFFIEVWQECLPVRIIRWANENSNPIFSPYKLRGEMYGGHFSIVATGRLQVFVPADEKLTKNGEIEIRFIFPTSSLLQFLKERQNTSLPEIFNNVEKAPRI